MSNLKPLMASVEEARERLSAAENERDLFLEPILQVLGAKGGRISRCHASDKEMYITRSGSCRGSGWDDDYTFPLSIFDCDDPLKAAREFVLAQKAAQEKTDRREKLKTLRQLQKELDV